jgi:CO dehydrogenase flavoprotein C-terminal domain
VVVDIGPALRGDGDAGSASVYDLVASALDPTDDIHATAAYRRHLAATLTVRAVDRALARAHAGTQPELAAVSDAMASPTSASSDVGGGGRRVEP